MLLEKMTKAKIFAELHYKKEPFILANAWDAASAKIFEKAGFAAIGTTSAGIAAARGYPDGQHIPLSEMLDSIEQIFQLLRYLFLWIWRLVLATLMKK